MKNTMNKKMKQFALSIVLAFTFTAVQAQSAEFGLRFMPTYSAFDIQSSEGGVIKGTVTLGYGLGAFIGLNLTDNFGLQGEVIYSSINQKYTELDVEKKITLQYINIPLLAVLNTGKSLPVNLSIAAGPQLGISIGSSFDGSVEGDSLILVPVLAVKKGDLGVAYGAGIDFGLDPANMIRFGLGFRGVFGLLDISDDSKSQTTDKYYVLDRTQIKTYSVYVGLSVLF